MPRALNINRVKRAEEKEKKLKPTVLINMAIFAKYYTGSLKDTQEAMAKDGFEVSLQTLMRYAAEPEFSEMVIDVNRNKEGIAQSDQVKCLMSKWMFSADDPALRMRAAENVARMHGLFKDKIQIDNQLSLTSALDDLLGDGKSDSEGKEIVKTEGMSLTDAVESVKPKKKPRKK
jgi:hypothetical protein